MAHRDLEQLSKTTLRRARKAGFTSENLFRAILVMQREGFEYRETSVRIAESEHCKTSAACAASVVAFTENETLVGELTLCVIA